LVPIPEPDQTDRKAHADALLRVRIWQVLDNKPSFTFWTTLAKTFENQSKEASRGEPIG
jgi:hypothetical protein